MTIVNGSKDFLFFYRASQIGIAQIHPTILIHQVEGNDYFDITDLFCSKVIPETICQYIPHEKFWEGDILQGTEKDEYGTVTSSWIGVVKYDASTGRIRVLDDSNDWYETDDFMYDEIIGNAIDNPQMLKEIECDWF